jgi:light-harvesting complex 1 alpha chain
MYRIWKLFDPRFSLIAVAGLMAALALLIHLLILATPDFNWLGAAMEVEAPSTNMSAMPPARNIN